MGGAASGQGRSTGSPGQQSDPLIVSVRTGEQLPAPEFLDVRHVVPVPGASHQGFQGLHSGTGEGRQQTGGPPQPHPYYRCDPVPTCDLPVYPNLPENLLVRGQPSETQTNILQL